MEALEIAASIFAACVIAILILIGYSVLERSNDEWEEFYRTHNCQLVKEIAPTTSLGVDYTGTGTVIVVNNPGQKCYVCNDGKQYCR